MKVSELIAILQGMPQDVEVEINDTRSAIVYNVQEDCIGLYTPNLDLWPDDTSAVVIEVGNWEEPE